MSTKKTIVAIGGGELRCNETFAIDEYIVKSTKKSTPKVLFIPTASGDSEGYIETVKHIYGDELGCLVTSLKIITETPSDAEICEMILSADIIYVGGGNTDKMMEAWKSRGVDDYLRKAYNNGIILTGLSAGSICWFEHGHSDSFLDETGQYCVVDGLGMIYGLHCPHYNERLGFDEFMKTQNKPAVAIEDNCAVVFQDDYYKVVKSNNSANAFLFDSKNGEIRKRMIDNSDFKPTKDLFQRDCVR
ncbi:MAG: peptidase E [Defluviitaleaceae bacterium]|nr:peptidase E [Defluviitaleaceae bacterium]